jgi:hypothetical protein
MLARYAGHLCFGTRHMSMFEIIADSLPQNLAEDKELNEWFDELRRDPFVRLGTPIVAETQHLFRTALRTSTSLLTFALSPILYPLSKYLTLSKPTLAPCPFPTNRDFQISGRGEIAITHLNLLDRARQHFRNLANSIASSRSPILRHGYKIAGAIITVPLHFLLEPSKESLVITAIQRYFPTFNVADFVNWMEFGFLPFFMDSYLRGSKADTTILAMPNIVQERQLQIADLVLKDCTLRSRLLSISDVEVMDFDFKGHMPVLVVKFAADHTEEVRAGNGEILSGGPEEIRRTEIIAEVGVHTAGSVPVWKVAEFHQGVSNSRI